MCQDCLDISEYRFTLPQNCDKNIRKVLVRPQQYILCLYFEKVIFYVFTRNNILYK